MLVFLLLVFCVLLARGDGVGILGVPGFVLGVPVVGIPGGDGLRKCIVATCQQTLSTTALRNCEKEYANYRTEA